MVSSRLDPSSAALVVAPDVPFHAPVAGVVDGQRTARVHVRREVGLPVTKMLMRGSAMRGRTFRGAVQRAG